MNLHQAKKSNPPKGFTLVELLVVIAIIAVVSIIVVIVLNPAELLKQSRDSTRLADLETINKTVALYATDQTAGFGVPSTTYISVPDPMVYPTSTCMDLGIVVSSSIALQCSATSTYKSINGSGWIPLNLALISAGLPISSWPVDPVNATSSGLYFTYNVSGNTWGLSAGTESKKYGPGGSANGTITNNGGPYSNNGDRYEIGTNLALLPFDPSGALSPPTISGISALAATSTATITWTTDEFSNSIVNYGTTTLNYSYSTTGIGTNSVFLTSLTPDTTYYYQVQSSNAGGITTSTILNFMTGMLPPYISNVSSSNIGSGTATITWTTADISSSTVNYGTSTLNYSSSTSAADASSTHSVFLTSLTPSTTYYYQVQSSDAGGITTSTGNPPYFTTIPAFATIIPDSSSTTPFTSRQTSTSTITVGNNGSNEILMICQALNAADYPIAITVNGGQAIPIATTTDVALYYYLNALPGPNMVSSTLSAATVNRMGLASYFGVNQSDPIDSHGSSKVAGTTPSSTIMVNDANEYVVDCLRTAGTPTLSANSGQVTTSDYSSAAPTIGASYLPVSIQGPINTGWTLSTSETTNGYINAGLIPASQ